MQAKGVWHCDVGWQRGVAAKGRRSGGGGGRGCKLYAGANILNVNNKTCAQ